MVDELNKREEGVVPYFTRKIKWWVLGGGFTQRPGLNKPNRCLEPLAA